MRRIKLTRGKWATVDEEFYEAIHSMSPWFCHGQGYAARNRYDPETQVSTVVFMHHVIATLAGMAYIRVDHENGRKRDNRIKNLRSATHAENNRNKGKQRNNTSGYKGVSWNKSAQKWTARINNGTTYEHLGLFPSKRAAARAYDEGALKYHGSFAFTNFKRAA
jgi:hypothetical protein